MAERGAAVAAGSALAVEAAAEALRAGGSAVDAVIAGVFGAMAAEPVLAGLMGGGFLMVREPSGRARLLDGFTATPRRKTPEADADLREIEADFGDVRQAFHIGAATVACPGLAPLIAEAHARFGRAPLPDLAAPAVEALRRGRPLAAFQAEVMAVVAPIVSATPGARALYCGGEATPLKAGAAFANPALADVLETFAAEGPRFVQEGEPAAALAAFCADGGHLTREDLAAYRAAWRTPLDVARGDARIALNPPPAAGGALVAFALALLDPGAPPAARAQAFRDTALARVEAKLADDAEAGAARLLAPETIARWRRLSAPRGTTHVSAVDADGLGAALSLSNGEGCGAVLPGLGVMPNNMLGEADLTPDPFGWTPGVRLSSMMTPAAVTWRDGRVALLGSGGSNRIRSAMAQALAHLIDDRMPLEAAVAAPRLHAEGDGTVDFEDRFAESERAGLLAAFPEARPWARDSMFFGGVHAVARTARGAVEAAGDPRRDGAAARV
ncbi:MAG: Gamma-glutamyltranspeptidase [Rhodobacteraceae bacterium]|nr:MAG: Gamma-glutamyltranspeptidase [Paracoccaceae bacterium]